MAVKKCTRMTFTALFTMITLGLTNAQWAIDDSGCRTPGGGVGNCVIIRECTSIQNILNRVESLTPDVTGVLGNYRCGFQGKYVKVCCPETPITIKVPGGVTESTPLPINPTIPKPPDVSNHKNIALLPTFTNCGHNRLTMSRITAGDKTSLYDFPWMALLSYHTRFGPDFRCGGTLINTKYILTAAHCITNLKNLVLFGVRLGEYNISSTPDCEREGDTIICADPVQDFYIEDVIPHPDYNPDTHSDDIGLLRLRTPAKFKKSVQPICLPVLETLRNKNFSDTKLLVTGWGSTGSESTRSDDLLKVKIPVIPEEECQIAYHNTTATINYKQLCAGGRNGRDSCSGDSGGPLQLLEPIEDDVHFIQYGIVSFGPLICGQEGLPGVYTNIAYYMDWILDNMRS